MGIAEKLTTIAENEQKVYEAGQKSEYDRFWDAVQNSGNRTNYNRGFCGMTWTDENFKPKYDIRPSESNAAYYMFGYAAITDLAKILEEKKVVLDTSNASGLFQEMFANSKVTRIPTLNITKASGSAAVTNMFANCGGLTTIEKIIISENTPTGYMFNGVSNLENVIFEGVIGNNIDFSTCSKLTHESLMSIINALKNFSTLTTVTYHHGEYGNYSISETNLDPKGVEWTVTDAVLNGTTLICHGYNEDNNFYDVTITVTDINISAEDVAKIRTIQFDVASYNPETYEFIVDVVIKVSGEPTQFKTLTLGNENLLKLTEAEKKKATNKGWTLA